MSLEALIERHAAALDRNSDLLEKVVANQTAVLEKVEAAPKPGGRTRRSAEAPAASAATPAAEEKAQPAAAAPEDKQVDEPTITDDELRALANGWLTSTEDKEERARRGAFLKSVLTELGAEMLAGPNGIKDPFDRKKARFFLQRKAEGLPVDFSADYDFDGDPTQGDGEPAAEEESFVG